MKKREYTESRKRADQKYQSSTDLLRVRMPKGKKKAIESHLEGRTETIGQFVNRAIDEAMEREKEEARWI